MAGEAQAGKRGEHSPFHSCHRDLWCYRDGYGKEGDFGQVGKRKGNPFRKMTRVMKYIVRGSKNLLIRRGACWTENI